MSIVKGVSRYNLKKGMLNIPPSYKLERQDESGGEIS
jgi:hypothetical protein